MRFSLRLTLLAAMSAAFVLPAHALSLGSYSLIEGSRTSIGGLSNSITASSNGSSTAVGLAQGDYTLVEVAAVNDQPDMVRMALQAVDRDKAENDVYVLLPAKTYLDAGLQAGQVISAKQRPYGVELAKANDSKPFFLLVQDSLLEELKSKPVES